MQTILKNVQAVIASIEAGDLCDTGHYYCPCRQGDGSYRFPSGAVLHTDGRFVGPRRLVEQLGRIAPDYRPDPVPPTERYPQRADGGDPFGELAQRRCAQRVPPHCDR
jgi:hypothetical protein